MTKRDQMRRERQVRREVEKVRARWDKTGKRGQATQSLVNAQVKKYAQQEPHKFKDLQEYTRNI